MIEYCQIELTQGQVARVSPEDFGELSRHKWHAHWDPRMNSFYAVRNVTTGYRSQTRIIMHRKIAGNPIGLVVDHVNGNTLDNRRDNLRICTQAENTRNRKTNINNTSGFKGVSLRRRTGRWQANIGVGRKMIYLGSYLTPEEAHVAYCEAAKRIHGEFWRAA